MMTGARMIKSIIGIKNKTDKMLILVGSLLITSFTSKSFLSCKYSI